jgi:membrane-associated phospholipid phosphatase
MFAGPCASSHNAVMYIRLVLSGLMALFLSGCAHVKAGKIWGEGATISPGWPAVKQALVEAVTDPYTWVPALTAAALQIGDADNDIAYHLRRNNPVFGSTDTADDVSDALRLVSIGAFVGLGLAAPGPEDSSQWWRTKVKGLFTAAAAYSAASEITEGLKTVTSRTRPNGENDLSLPSGHAASTAAAARLALDTLAYYELGPGARIAAHAGLVTLTAATAWARVEAGKHHPSDVLLGAALGNFIAIFTTHAFLHPVLGERALMNVAPLTGGGVVMFGLAY